MKSFTTLLVVLAIFLYTNSTISQFTNEKNMISVVTPPAGFNANQQSLPFSVITTVDGFDNIYLGTDFGEPYIATNPKDPLNSFCAFNINNLYYTLDGVNWTKNNPAFPGFSILGDPVMCYDSLGTAYYVQLYQNGGTYGVTIIHSTNKGVSWSGAYNVASTNAGLSDKEWVTADQTGGPYTNNVYIGWRQFGSGGMRFVRSTDGGVTWSAPLVIPGSQGAYVSVGPNGSIPGGSVYFACISGNSILVNRSTDGGLTFSSQVTAAYPAPPGVYCAGRRTVKNCIRMDAFPRMAADNGYTSTRGYVYVAYATNPAGSDNCDINVVRSTDYGVTWSNPVRVNDDNTITDQWMPAISVDRNGKVYVCWYDSRIDPGNNLMTMLYGSVSTDGGQTFSTNYPISNTPFNPNNMAVGQPGGEKYIGDYIGISAIGNTSYSVWMDGRNNSLGSYVGYFPDFALTVNPSAANLVNSDSTSFTVKIPAVKGPYTGSTRFTASLDSLPAQGTINVSFLNNRDSLTSYPDSLTLKVTTSANVTPRLYKLNIKGMGTNGVPVHLRTVDLLVNSSLVDVGTNRNGTADFKVNGISYNTRQEFVFSNNSVVTVQAISPKIVSAYKYIYLNWSDNGDTTHNVTVTNNFSLTANYKVQYKILLTSAVGNTFGGNEFYDSAAAFTFGVLSRVITYNNQEYYFHGWTGNGSGSYTSPDSSGNDTAITLSMNNPVLETARWSNLIGIQATGTEIPQVYKLYQNYPNPFNPSTTINFDIVKAGIVRIVLYDVLGREVKTIVNEYTDPGRFKVVFTADNLASGLYFYKITSNEFTDVKKLLIVK
jgi:Secretion system C-terminal sorting domain